ncbi:MAG: hypothetical protein ACPIC3_04450, partial [Candidatus Puniceispirillaceae bacterium]
MARLSGALSGALFGALFGTLSGAPVGGFAVEGIVKKEILFCRAPARPTLFLRRRLAGQHPGNNIKGLRRGDAGNGP